MNNILIFLIFCIIVIFAILLINILTPTSVLTPSSVLKSGGNASKFEEYVRDKFQKLLGVKFPTKNPNWLLYKGKPLELDGFSEKLGIAFEVQGPQHYEYSVQHYSNYYEFIERIKKDEFKIKMSKKFGYYLIIVDYMLPKDKIAHYIGSRIWDLCNDYNIGIINYKKVNYDYLIDYPSIWTNITHKPALYIEKIVRYPDNKKNK